MPSRRPRRFVALANQQDRRHLRAQVGRLSHTLIQPMTLTRYRAAVASFSQWVSAHGQQISTNIDYLDFQVAEWIEYLWHDGRGANEAGDTLSGLQFLLRRRRILPSSWALFGAWRRIELPHRVPPLPHNLLLAMASVARFWCRNDVAVLLIIGFAGFLRTTEMVSLCKWQLQISLDRSSVVVLLPITKSGLRHNTEESVVIADPSIARFVEHMLQHLRPEDCILQSSVSNFRFVFNSLLDGLGVRHLGFKPYSLRRGGATYFYQKYKNMPAALEIGRWRDTQTARIYITQGVEILLQLAFSPYQQQRFAALGQVVASDI